MEEIRTVILVLGAGVLMGRMVRVLKNLRAEGFLGTWKKKRTQAREARKRKKGGMKEFHRVVWCPEEKTHRCLTCEELTGVGPWIVR